MADFTPLTQAVQAGQRDEAKRLTREALERGDPPGEVLDAMVAGMDEVGRQFSQNEIFVPEMLIASRAMKESLDILEPALVEAGIQPEHTAVIGTVEGDLHDIGKNLVAMMWKGANFAVHDLGTNVSPQQFAEAAKEHNADLVGLSALLTTTMPSMKDTVAAVREANLDHVKVLIGGAPVTEDFAQEIGADGYAPDAASAVDRARDLVGSSS